MQRLTLLTLTANLLKAFKFNRPLWAQNKLYMEYSYFKITLKQTDKETVYMVRSDKVSEFFNNKIDYLQGDCSITVKGRFPTHKDSRKWFIVSPK